MLRAALAAMKSLPVFGSIEFLEGGSASAFGYAMVMLRVRSAPMLAQNASAMDFAAKSEPDTLNLAESRFLLTMPGVPITRNASPMTSASSSSPPPCPTPTAPFHIGHIMEYIQADIWVRFQRMQGHEVHFVCADDAHGAPIMIAAEKPGITPQAAGRAHRRRAQAISRRLSHRLRQLALDRFARKTTNCRRTSTASSRPRA